MITTPHWPIPLGAKPIDLGLSRIRALLARLGNPHHALPPVIHVAGTNGKGSTIAFLRAMLEAAGHKVHVYTSPHLIAFNERIVLAGEIIDDDRLYHVLEECRQAAGSSPITFFEGTTAAAFLAFSQVKADVVLLETGLGGRLDATNVIDHPALTLITPVSFDHTEFLGNTLASIAGEKAGILKPNTPCVVSLQAPEARGVILARANAPVFLQDRDWQVVKHAHGFSYEGETALNLPMPSLLGDHQLTNAGAAITALLQLKDFACTQAHILHGLTHAHHPARLQALTGNLAKLLPQGWELWLDGGHNQAGGEALAKVAENWQDQPLYLISGMLQGKDAAGFFKAFKGKVTKVLCITIPNEPKSHSPASLRNAVEKAGLASAVAESVEQAIETITAWEPGRILICGSLYLAGSILTKENNGGRGRNRTGA